jgi:hypothetical protein
MNDRVCVCDNCTTDESFVIVDVRQTDPRQWQYVTVRGQRFGSAHTVAVDPTHDIVATLQSLGFVVDGPIPDTVRA